MKHTATKKHCKYTGKLIGYEYREMTIQKRSDYFHPFQIQDGAGWQNKHRFRTLREAKEFINARRREN